MMYGLRGRPFVSKGKSRRRFRANREVDAPDRIEPRRGGRSERALLASRDVDYQVGVETVRRDAGSRGFCEIPAVVASDRDRVALQAYEVVEGLNLADVGGQ